MRALIMAGGRGVRLHPYTLVLPKPMLPLGDRPILAWLLERLVAHGVTDMTLAIGYMEYVFRAYFGKGRFAGATVRYRKEKQPLGTAGALRWAQGWTDPFLVSNADLVTDLNFTDLYRFHVAEGAWLTVASQVRSVRSPWGLLETDGTNLLAYHEKPLRSDRTSLGIYVVDPQVLMYLPPAGPCDMPDLIRVLLADGRPVKHFETEALWFDLGSPAEYEAMIVRWPHLKERIGGTAP